MSKVPPRHVGDFISKALMLTFHGTQNFSFLDLITDKCQLQSLKRSYLNNIFIDKIRKPSSCTMKNPGLRKSVSTLAIRKSVNKRERKPLCKWHHTRYLML